MATWVRTPGIVECYRGACRVNIPRGELVCLVSVAKLPACRGCAKQLFGYDPPANVPQLPELRTKPAAVPSQLQLSDSAEPPPSSPWTRYNRTDVAKQLSRRALKEANAIDPKLRQLGGDR